jgi:hypothetical protein
MAESDKCLTYLKSDKGIQKVFKGRRLKYRLLDNLVLLCTIDNNDICSGGNSALAVYYTSHLNCVGHPQLIPTVKLRYVYTICCYAT